MHSCQHNCLNTKFYQKEVVGGVGGSQGGRRHIEMTESALRLGKGFELTRYVLEN